MLYHNGSQGQDRLSYPWLWNLRNIRGKDSPRSAYSGRLWYAGVNDVPTRGASVIAPSYFVALEWR